MVGLVEGRSSATDDDRITSIPGRRVVGLGHAQGTRVVGAARVAVASGMVGRTWTERPRDEVRPTARAARDLAARTAEATPPDTAWRAVSVAAPEVVARPPRTTGATQRAAARARGARRADDPIVEVARRVDMVTAMVCGSQCRQKRSGRPVR